MRLISRAHELDLFLPKCTVRNQLVNGHGACFRYLADPDGGRFGVCALRALKGALVATY